MPTLVTGGSGFVGSFALRQLVSMREDSISFSTKLPPRDISGKVKSVLGDVRSFASILSAIKLHRVDRIIHAASLLGYASQEEPMLAFETNVLGTMNVLEAARIMDVDRIVYVSGQSIYGDSEEETPITEEHALLHRRGWIYPSTKCFGENMGLSYAENYGLGFTAVRLSLVYGPGKERGYQAFKNCVEDAFFKKIVKIPEGGDQKWDALYVKDAANGLVLAAFARKPKHRIFNIGSGAGRMYSLRDLAKIVATHIPDARFEIGPGNMSMMESLRGPLDITKARKELHYEPRYPLLEDGVKDYIQDLRKEASDNAHRC